MNLSQSFLLGERVSLRCPPRKRCLKRMLVLHQNCQRKEKATLAQQALLVENHLCFPTRHRTTPLHRLQCPLLDNSTIRWGIFFEILIPWILVALPDRPRQRYPLQPPDGIQRVLLSRVQIAMGIISLRRLVPHGYSSTMSILAIL